MKNNEKPYEVLPDNPLQKRQYAHQVLQNLVMTMVESIDSKEVVDELFYRRNITRFEILGYTDDIAIKVRKSEEKVSDRLQTTLNIVAKWSPEVKLIVNEKHIPNEEMKVN